MNDDDDLKPQDYQDDFDTDSNKTDRATHELTDDLADHAGIPRHELAHELKKLNIDDQGRGNEDMREHLEDLDEDEGRLKSTK